MIEGQYVPGGALVAVNQRSGQVVALVALADSSFRVELEAQSGDAVSIYADGSPLGAPWALTVP